MPYPPEHRRKTRERIIRSAQALFNRHGFGAVSIDDLMKQAGLTRGGFYSYFRSKSELYAEAVALSLEVTPWSRWDGVSVDFAARDAARQVVDAYLSREHFGDVDGSCPWSRSREMWRAAARWSKVPSNACSWRWPVCSKRR